MPQGTKQQQPRPERPTLLANPFLVLGGIAISVATAAFGILQVPGWVASAQDAAATNDIAQVSAAQAAMASERGSYAPSLGALAASGSVKVTPSGGVRLYAGSDPTGKHHLTVARSASGAYFARTSDRSDIGRGTTIESAVVGAGTTVSGAAGARLTAEGVPVPVERQLAETVYENLFRNSNVRTTAGFDAWYGDGGTGVMERVAANWAHSGSAVRFTQTKFPTGGDGSHYDIRAASWMEPNTRYTLVWDAVGQGKHRPLHNPRGWPTADVVAQPHTVIAASSTQGMVFGPTPQTLWVTFETPPVISPNLQFFVHIPLEVNDWIEYGNVQLYEGDYDPDRPWFSGDRIAGSDMKVEWAGDPNSSKAYAWR